MELHVHAHHVLHIMHIQVSAAQLLPDGSDSLPNYWRQASIVMPVEVQDGSHADQLAFLAESLLDMAYDRRI